MSSFDDFVHAHDDDDDDDDDNDIDLDEIMNFDELFSKWESKGEIKVSDDDALVIGKEECLSKKLRQSESNKRPSTSEPDDDSVMKKLKTQTQTTTTMSHEQTPPYLRTQYEIFDRTMGHFIRNEATSITIEDLREIAVLIHDLQFSNLLISQWQTYLYSGTGEFEVLGIKGRVSIWPIDVKKTMIREKLVTVSNESEIDVSACLVYTESYLRQLHDHVGKLQIQLDTRKSHLNGYTNEMHRVIEQYVCQQYMNQAQLRIQTKIIMVEFDYHDRLLQWELEGLRPSHQQLQFCRELYQANCEYQKSKTNVDLLKQHVFYKEYPDTFDSVRLPCPIDLQSINDLSIRHALHHRYQRIVQQTKSDLILIHVAVAEAKLRQCYAHLKRIENDPSDDQRLTSEMMIVMQRRFKDYEERMYRLYNLKMNFFVKAPTVLKKNM